MNEKNRFDELSRALAGARAEESQPSRRDLLRRLLAGLTVGGLSISSLAPARADDKWCPPDLTLQTVNYHREIHNDDDRERYDQQYSRQMTWCVRALDADALADCTAYCRKSSGADPLCKGSVTDKKYLSEHSGEPNGRRCQPATHVVEYGTLFKHYTYFATFDETLYYTCHCS